MKRHSIFFALSAAFCALLSGCGNMQVATDVIKMYPMTCLIDQVKVYDGDKSPANYEHLGTVAVFDQGMARVTPFETTLDMAKRAVCETGGNALYIARHELPNSLVSTNHQIIGQILLESKEPSDVQSAPAKNLPLKKELPDYVASRYNIPDGPNVINGYNIYFSGGYGRLLTKAGVLDESITINMGSVENGFEYEFGFEHIMPDGHWGVGAFCSNFVSTFDGAKQKKVSVKDSALSYTTERKFDGKFMASLHMVGPAVSYSKTDEHLFLSARAGLGLAWQTESFAYSEVVYGTGIDSESGVEKGPVYHGASLQLSGEIGYRLSSIITVGATLGASGYFMIYDTETTKSLSVIPLISLCPTIRFTL